MRRRQDIEYELLYRLLGERFGFELRGFGGILDTVCEQQIAKLEELVSTLNLEQLFALENMAGILKSTTLAVLLAFDCKSPGEALNLARLEENYQQEFFGKIDDVHEFEEKELLVHLRALKMFWNESSVDA